MGKPLQPDSFEFDLIGADIKPFGGYVSSVDKTIVTPNVMIHGSKNVYRKLSGTIASRPGLKQYDPVDSTSNGITSSFEWDTSLGASLPLRYVAAIGKLQVLSSISGSMAWYDLLTSLTATSIVFDTWWDDANKKDKLLFVLGDSSMRAWDGGVATISSTTNNTIVLDRDAGLSGFTSAGNVLVNGNSYSYSGISSATLTGVSGDPSGEANVSVVLSKVITTTNTPASGFTNDFLRVVNSQAYVGSYTSRLDYVSNQADYTDYGLTNPRVAGDPSLITMDAAGKGIGIRQGVAVLFAGTSLAYEINFNPITVGTTLTEQTEPKIVQLETLTAPLRHEFIDMVGDDILYVDQGQRLRVYGTFPNVYNQPRFPIVSLPIYDELRNENLNGGHLRAVDRIVYITAPEPGRDWMYETRQDVDRAGNIVAEKFWHPPQIRSLSRIAVIAGVVYGYSSQNPQLYQLWDTAQWHDDSPDGTPIPYACTMRMAYRSEGRRAGMLAFNKVYCEGYMSPGTNLYENVYWDYQGSSGISSLIINTNESPASFFSGTNAPSLGDASLGDNPLGDGITVEDDDQEQLPKFRVINDVSPEDSFEYSLEVFSQDVDARWEILCLGPNVAVSDRQAGFIRK